MSDLAQIGDLAQIAKSADVHISTSPSGLFYIAHGRKTFISLYFVRRRKTFIFALFCAWMKNIYSHALYKFCQAQQSRALYKWLPCCWSCSRSINVGTPYNYQYGTVTSNILIIISSA